MPHYLTPTRRAAKSDGNRLTRPACYLLARFLFARFDGVCLKVRRS